MDSIKETDWVEYKVSKLKFTGFVEDAEDGLYWFKTLDMLIENRKAILIAESDINVLPNELKRADIEAMIDLALQTKDEEWFNELSTSLNVLNKGYFDWIAWKNEQSKTV